MTAPSPRSRIPAVERVSDEVLGLLLQHSWPGTMRELENAMERAVILYGKPILTLAHFPTLRRAGAEPGRSSSTALLDISSLQRRLNGRA